MLGAVLRFFGIAVALIAVLIGTVGTMQPELFFGIPKVGFIFWAMTGHDMPPNFDSAPLKQENFRKWAQDGDVIVATMPKAGTMWILNIVNLLKLGGETEYDFVADVTGLQEIKRHPYDDLETRLARETAKRDQNLTDGQPAPRWMAWMSHKFPDSKYYGFDVRKQKGMKYIGIVRNAFEVLRSFHPFMNGWPPEFKTLWGGFPPTPMNKEAIVNMLAKDLQDM